MRDTLIERKNDIQGNYSRVNKAESQINDLEHNEAKKQAIRTSKKKKESKKMRII